MRRWLCIVVGGALATIAAVSGPSSDAPPLLASLVGSAAGWLAFRLYVSRRADNRDRRITAEAPAVADIIALRILAGESVVASLEYVEGFLRGPLRDEIAHLLERHRLGHEMSYVLDQSANAMPRVRRLFTLLSSAHRSGGRLADSLVELAADLRSQQARSLTAEGGKRAVAVYAPIIALMVPVTLLFLMYPTLAGLSELAGGP